MGFQGSVHMYLYFSFIDRVLKIEKFQMICARGSCYITQLNIKNGFELTIWSHAKDGNFFVMFILQIDVLVYELEKINVWNFFLKWNTFCNKYGILEHFIRNLISILLVSDFEIMGLITVVGSFS